MIYSVLWTKLIVPFVKPRDSLYAKVKKKIKNKLTFFLKKKLKKVRKDLPRGEKGEDEGFIFSVRSVKNEEHPLNPNFIRVHLKYAVYVVPDKKNGGIIYTSTQLAGIPFFSFFFFFF